MSTGSSDMIDSVTLCSGSQSCLFLRASSERSNFSQRCTLFSQYLKEKGSFGDVAFAMNSSFFEPNAGSYTNNSLSSPDSSSSQEDLPKNTTATSPNSVNKSEAAGAAQMTIFYAGEVIVFDDFPADKANEIMLLAGKIPSRTFAQLPKPVEESTTMIMTPAATNAFFTPNFLDSNQTDEQSKGIHHPLPPRLVSDLPIARKASLARFLEKRKDRLTTRTPYQQQKSSSSSSSAISSKPEDSNHSWLAQPSPAV